MPTWHYLRTSPHRAITSQILDHMIRRGRVGEFVYAAHYQSVIYYALKGAQGAVSAVICPLDRSGEFGRFTIGYCALEEDALPEEIPPVWARCPDQIIAALSPTASSVANEWRTRCVKFRAAKVALGSIKKGSLIRLTSYLELDGKRCRLLQCLDSRGGFYELLDGPGSQPVHLSRDAIAEHGGVQCNGEDALELLGAGFDEMQLFVRRKSR